ncbi:MAG: hypothetical protein ACI9W6_000308, partial [Motiliproteus sp.]
MKVDSFDIFWNLNGFSQVGVPTTFILSDLDWIANPGTITGVWTLMGTD